MVTIEEISSLLESKLNEKFSPVIERLERIEERLNAVESKLDKVLEFVPTGNDDVIKKLKRAH